VKAWKKISLFILFFVISERFCYSQTEGFTPSKIISGTPSQSSLETPTICTQPFYFLGSGKQFYAFESEDGTTVIKFIKQSRRRPLPFLANLSLPAPLTNLRNLYLEKRKKRLEELIESCRIASEEIAQETGVIGTYLKNQPSASITLFDKLGIAHQVELGATQFLLQKKAALLTSPLSHDSIDGMVELTSTLALKGIVNLDPMIKRNFGVIGDRVMLIDFGSLKKDPRVAFYPGFQRTLLLQLLGVRQHLQNNQPDYVAYFDQQMQKTL
jgi:hypothetical protein